MKSCYFYGSDRLRILGLQTAAVVLADLIFHHHARVCHTGFMPASTVDMLKVSEKAVYF